MPNKNYEKGRRHEYRTLSILKQQGALWVRRSYGSKGIFDCWALFPDKFVAIQVKSNYISKQEYAWLAEFATKLKSDNLKVQLWFFRSPRMKPEVHEFVHGSFTKTR